MTHVFEVEVAQELGVTEAILIAHFQFWIKKNKANNLHEHDGRTWTYNSMKAFEELFPYWSIQTIRTALKHLTERGVLLTANYSEKPFDRTLWYAFQNEDRWICGNQQMDLLKSTNGFVKINKPIPDIIPDNNISSNIPTINNLDNITTKETSKESYDVEHGEIEELIYSWLMNDKQIRVIQFIRLGLINKETTKEEFETILREYITKYYEKCRLDGEADIRERGRNRVMSHFNNWLSKFKRLQDYEKEKQEFTNQKPKKDGWNKQDFLAALNS